MLLVFFTKTDYWSIETFIQSSFLSLISEIMRDWLFAMQMIFILNFFGVKRALCASLALSTLAPMFSYYANIKPNSFLFAQISFFCIDSRDSFCINQRGVFLKEPIVILFTSDTVLWLENHNRAFYSGIRLKMLENNIIHESFLEFHLVYIRVFWKFLRQKFVIIKISWIRPTSVLVVVFLNFDSFTFNFFVKFFTRLTHPKPTEPMDVFLFQKWNIHFVLCTLFFLFWGNELFESLLKVWNLHLTIHITILGCSTSLGNLLRKPPKLYWLPTFLVELDWSNPSEIGFIHDWSPIKQKSPPKVGRL